MNEVKNVEALRELGKAYFFHSEEDHAKRIEGLKMLVEAKRVGDLEATYIIAKLVLDNVIELSGVDSQKHGLSLMYYSANKGYIQARSYLNSYCIKKYEEKFKYGKYSDYNGPLVDFDGKPVKISRKGVFTPVDAELEYINGKNILTLSANIAIIGDEAVSDSFLFREAIIDGILKWQGEYEVFGGQKISVRLNLTEDYNLYDNVYVMPITPDYEESIQKLYSKIGTKKMKEKISRILFSKRSFAAMLGKWSTTSRKIIYIQSRTPEFDDYEEIIHVAKHEFGHVLGLGDLYYSPSDNLGGVEYGTYADLDSYAVNDKLYNLVMCDCHGLISNNDIEMVLLAFSKNKMQLFQSQELPGEKSEALGRGN